MRDHASSVFEVKRRLRREVWRRLDREGIATYPRPCYGHIPNFRGNMTASWKLIRTETFRRATAVLVSPDPAHRLVRMNALSRGKTLLSYTPGLRRGFVLLRPEDVPRGHYEAASSPRGAIRYGVLISSERDLKLLEGIKLDLVVLGSVAVDEHGGRLGRGVGEGDLAYGMLKELGLVDSRTPVATVVHDIQLIESVPMEDHDVPVDYVFTPTRALRIESKHPKPLGVIWDKVTVDMAREIPLLAALSGFEFLVRRRS